MSTNVQEVKFNPEQKKNLAMQIGDVINTEISVIEPIIKAYSNSPYFQSKIDSITKDCIKKRLLDFCSRLPYVGINITLLFDKAPICTNMMSDQFYIGTVMNIHYHGENIPGLELSHVDMTDSMIEVHVGPDKWEEFGLYKLEGGPYGAIMVRNAYIITDDGQEDSHEASDNNDTSENSEQKGDESNGEV